MKVLLIKMILLTWSITSYAQYYHNLGPWFDGIIYLNENKQISGNIYVNLDQNVLIHRDLEGKLKAFSAFKVQNFIIYDNRTKEERFFQSCNFTDPNQSSGNFFMELITTGEIQLLRKEKKAFIPFGDNPYLFTSNLEYLSNHNCFNYFAWKDNRLIKIKNFRKQIKKLTADKWGEVEQFIKKRNLNLFHLRDQVKIIAYYNSLKNKNQVADDMNFFSDNHVIN